MHGNREVGQTSMLRRVPIGPRDENPEIGMVCARGPQLLTVDDPFVAVEDRPGGEAGEIGACAGLAEQLAPCFFTGKYRAQETFADVVVTVGEDGRAGEDGARPDRCSHGACRENFGGDKGVCPFRPTAAVPAFGPGGNGPACVEEKSPPFDETSIRIPVFRDPVLNLLADRLW